MSEDRYFVGLISGTSVDGVDAVVVAISPIAGAVAAVLLGLIFRYLTRNPVTARWSDSAGAYAFQGEGRRLLEHVEGSETNVIGLPLEESLALLRAEGIEANG